MFLSVYNVFGFLAARQAPYPAPAPQRVRKTVRDGGMTELAATRQFAAAFCGPERTPCSSKMKSVRFATYHLREI
jgi:hypothetical protein